VRPVADFTYQVDGYLLTLTNLSQNAISYFWDFGDGDFPFLENPVHFYTSEGEYNLRLIAHNDCEPDTMTMHIVVCQTPVPDFDYTCSHLKVSFLNTSLLNDSCFWNFGDGYGSFHQNPQHIYLEAGEYAVNLTVMHYCESGTLMTNELTQQINVPCSPTAAFIYDIREYEVTFTNNSLNATSSSWDFGDGETSEVTDPVHIYGEIGNYEVKLIAKNDHGSDTIKSLINVTSVPELPNENAVYVYPNPATDKIYLTIDKRHITLVQWQLLNIHGQLIKSDEQFPSNNISELDVSKLSKGIYLLRIISQGYISTQKLIIY
jgi:PKD repeat protein